MENRSEAIDTTEFDNNLHLPTEILSTTEHKPKGNNQNDSQIQLPTLSKYRWQASCQIACILCNAQFLTEKTSVKTTCDECGEEKYVVRP